MLELLGDGGCGSTTKWFIPFVVLFLFLFALIILGEGG